MNMIVSLTVLFVLLTAFVGQGYAVILTINPVAANVTVLTGNELVQLNCTSDTPVTIQWNYNGIPLPANHSTITVDPSFMISTLTLIDPDPDKSGEYSCFVPLIFDTFVSTTLNIFAPIYLMNSNSKVSALVGDTVTMHVSSLGLGQHTRRWTRRGRNVIKEDATGISTVQLTLPNVSVTDEGRYFFTATTQWTTNRTRVDLRVTYPPADITEHPQNRSVFLSLSTTFRCDANSPYPVTYSWRRVDSSLNITSQAIGLSTSTLVIPSVQRSDEGLYQCVVSVFGVESSSEPAYLAVKAPEILIQPQVDGLPTAVTRNVTRGTIEVRTPPVSDARGNISFIYIIVSSDGMVRPDKSTENLAYLDATHSGLVYYVAAALSYKEYSVSNTFTLGNTKITTGLNGQIFNNVKLNTDTAYYYFIRAYSLYYTEQNGLVSTSALYDIGSLPSDTVNDAATTNDDDDDDDDDGFPVTIAIAVLAGLVAMIIVLVCIIIFFCYYIISRNNRNRRNILRDLQKAAINIMKEDTMDSGASAKRDSTPKAEPNQYTELLASITEKDVQPYATLHPNDGGMANGNTRAASNSPCSVTSDDANENINPALGISEEKEKATIEEKEKAKDSETDFPSQETPGYVNVSNKSTPKKESKHSWFSFRSRKKSKSEETKTPQSDNANPLFDQKDVDSEETGYVDVVVEQLDNTAEVSGYTEVIREAPQDTKEESGYSNITKSAVNTEEVPGYGNISLELSNAKITDNSSNSITQTVHTNEENA